MKKKEFCNNTNDNEWMHCGVCGLRVHNPECTTRKVKGKDCLGDHSEEELEKSGYIEKKYGAK